MDDSPALMKLLQLPSFTLIGTMVSELREFNDKKKKKNNMDKMQKLFIVITWTKSGNFVFIWYTDYFQHDLCCKIIKSEINLKLKARSAFSNVWGEYKNHSNP